MLICRDKERKVKDTKLKYCRFQYTAKKHWRWNIQRREKQSKIYRNKTLELSVCRNNQRNLKYRELKYCRCQYTETREPKSNMQNWNTAHVNMQRGGKHRKVYWTEVLQMSIWRDKESKVKFIELKYCRRQYSEMRKGK